MSYLLSANEGNSQGKFFMIRIITILFLALAPPSFAAMASVQPNAVALEEAQEKLATARTVAIASVLLAMATSAVAMTMFRRQRHHGKREFIANSTPADDILMHVSSGQLTLDYLNLHASLTEKIEDTLRTLRRKISAGQIDEVRALLKSNKLLDENAILFNRVFDNTVLTLFPDFITNVNKLFLPDKHIPQTDDGQLTPELRILALSAIGIDDTTTTARFLGLSHNTIYTYRNRLRSRALNRDSLIADVRTIAHADLSRTAHNTQQTSV